MKAKLYKIHRILSLIIFLPVILWSLSGILHPVMATWFKIKPAQRTVIAESHLTDTTRISVAFLGEQNQTKQVENIGITHLNEEEVYQVKENGIISYYSSHTGKKVENGDEQYAMQLAKHYSGDYTSAIRNIEKVEEFTDQYKIINRLLPVYKVSLDRPDGLEVYVHTESGGLGTLNDKYRKAFIWSFSMFHNWNFLGSNQTFKSIVILLFSILVFLNGCLGLFIYWKNKKAFKAQKKGNDKLKPRKRHRKFSLYASIFLLAFSFSGGYHTFKKFDSVLLNDLAPTKSFTVNNIQFSLDSIIEKCGPITQISLAELNNETHIRVKDTNANGQFSYYNVADQSWLEHGDEKFAIERALDLSGLTNESVVSTEYITRFGGAYGFINKRLPVYAVHLNTEDNLTYYIETSTGIPGAVHSDQDKLEVLSFLMLHKYHFLNFMGKGWRDLVSALAAFSLVVISLTGIIIWIRTRKKKKVATK